MGRDCTAYKNIAFAKDYQQDWDSGDDYDKFRHLYPNHDFPDRADGLNEGLYTFEDADRCLSRTYDGYYVWRNQLALFAHGVPSETIWKSDKYVGKDFYELIMFADNEGFLGPKTCRKLLDDFNRNRERASAFVADDTDWFNYYESFRRGLEMAADTGAIKFH